MDLIKLPVGEPAEVDTDCIRIEELADGSYRCSAYEARWRRSAVQTAS